MTSSDNFTHPASTRHWLYGTNVFLLVLMATVILGFACYLTTLFPYRLDCTTGGINSLSPYTKKLLGELDASGKKYEITSLFGASSSQTEAEQARQVSDLLNEYGRYSRNLKLYQPDTLDELESKIKERYAGELKPYEIAVADYTKLSEQLEQFFKAEAPAFGQISQQRGLSDQDKRIFVTKQNDYANLIPEDLANIRKALKKSTIDSTSPKYSAALNSIKLGLEITLANSNLEQLSDPKNAGKFGPHIAAFVKENGARYSQMLQSVRTYQKSLEALKPLQMDEVLQSIGPLSAPGVLILTPDSVKVISYYDLFKQNRNATPNGDPAAIFEGEQTISSTLLGLVKPDKTKVVFVGTAPVRLTGGGLFSSIAERLAKANFDALEWSPPGPPMPGQPPSAITPPAVGKGVIWVVLPPEAPNPQQMMMGLPPPDARGVITAVKNHLDQGGSAMFLAEASNPMSTMGMDPASASAGYPYASLLKPFGIKVQAEYSVVAKILDRSGQTAAIPQILFSRYQPHAITTPLQSLPTIFFGGMTEMGLMNAVTLVTLDSPKPAEVTDTVLIQLTNEDNWASKQYTGPKTVFDPAGDLKGPLDLAVAATKGPEGKDQQRVVVFGNKLFATNDAIESDDRFPGNTELFMNSIRWLSGYQNMIAVGPRSSVALRIRDISPAALAWIDWGIIYLGAPVAALLSGAIVYFFRRRA